VRAGRHYVEADSPAEFATALCLLADAVGRGEEWLEWMLAEARAVAERLFWPRIARDLATTYRAMTAGAPRAGAPA
jgi:glycosyltransferase involved in cell wall biosynthesis